MKESSPSSELLRAREEIVRVQVERFHLFYQAYFDRPETIAMARFFFESVYNLEGKEEWEELALKTYSKVKNMMKETSRENIERLIELNTITDELDFRMGKIILQKHWKVGILLSQEEYFHTYQECGEKAKRKKQLEVVLLNLRKFYERAHKPIAAAVMKPADVISKMLGVYPLFQRIEQGYEATLHVRLSTFNEFYQEIEKREWEFYHREFPE